MCCLKTIPKKLNECYDKHGKNEKEGSELYTLRDAAIVLMSPDSGSKHERTQTEFASVFQRLSTDALSNSFTPTLTFMMLKI